MDDSKHKRGIWFNVLLFFDLFRYGTECLRGLSLDLLLGFGGWCLGVLRSSLLPNVDRRNEKQQRSREECNSYCLHSQQLSFYDAYSVVSGVPVYALYSDDTTLSQEVAATSSDAGTSQNVKAYFKTSKPHMEQNTAFGGKSSESVQACVFSKDDSHFAICYGSGKVTLWNTNHGTLLQEELLKNSSVCSISFLGEENYVLLICARDYTCWKWDIDNNGSRITKIFDKNMASSIGEQIFSQKSDFCKDGTKLVLSTIANSEDGSTLDVVLVDITSNPFKLELFHLTQVDVERDFVISSAVLSPDGQGILVSFMDQAFEDSYCLLWPDLSEHQTYYRRLNKGTIGSWSRDSRFVVTWIMTNKLNSNDKDENSAFIWNVEDMRTKLKNYEHLFKDEKIANPFGGNVFWCQVIQDMDKKDRLIMGVIGKTTRFLFVDMASKMHTHTIETGISAKDMILWNGEAWIQSYVAQRIVKGLSPMSVTKDGSMFGAVLGWPSEVIIWDVYLGIEILRIAHKDLQANQFKGGIDLMASPSCTKFAIVGTNGVMVFCPSAPCLNKERAKNCLETQMVQLENPHMSQDNLSRFKMSFSGNGDSLGVLCIGSSKMQIWNLLQSTSCSIKSNAQHVEEASIHDFCLSNNGQYSVINIGRCIQIMDCKTCDVAQMIGAIDIDSLIVSMGIKDDASELVLCMEDGRIFWYELSYEDVHYNNEVASPISNVCELVGHRLSLIERFKSWFKRPNADVNEPFIDDNEGRDQIEFEHISLHIPSSTCLQSCTTHVLAKALEEATFQVSPDFKQVIRISESQGVEAWDLETKLKLFGPFKEISFIERKACDYSHVSSITEQAHCELVARKNELLGGTSIDLSKRTTLVQSSRENIVVAGNSSLQGLSQRRDEDIFDFEYDEKTQEDSHSVYVINLNDVEYRRRLSGRNLEPSKGLAISHDGRHVACLTGDFGSKVIVWNVYASERLLPDYNFLSLTMAKDMSRKEGIKRDILPLIQDFGINFFNFRHPSGMSILEEAIYYFNNDLLKAILHYVSIKKLKISFLVRETPKDSTSSSRCHNMIEASIAGRSPKTLCVVLKYLLHRVTHEAEVVKILTESLIQVLHHYKSVFTRLIRDPKLLAQGQEIKVLERSLQGQRFRTSTSDSLNMSRHETQEFWEYTLKKDENEKRLSSITSTSSTFPYAQACNIGVHGILRNMLINRVHNLAFGSFAIKAVVDYKWKKYARGLWFAELYHHSLVCMSFTTYCLVLIHEESNRIDSEHYGEPESSLKGVTLLGIIYTTNHKIPGFVYWLTSGWNWIEAFSYINVVVVIPLGQCFLLKEGSHRAILSALVSVELLLIWSQMLYYARAFDRTGPLVITIGAVVREIFYFLILVLLVMIGFAFAFCVLHRHVEAMEDYGTDAKTFSHVNVLYDEATDDEEEDSKSMHEAFGTFKRSFFTVFRYTFGDLQMDILYNAPEPVTALSLFVLYVTIISFILLNTLSNVASEKLARIFKYRVAKLIEARARAIDDIDTMLSYKKKTRLRKDIGKYLHVMTASHRHSRIIKGSLVQPSLSKVNEDMTKNIRRDFRRVIDRSKRRTELKTPQTPWRRLTAQNTLGPYHPTFDVIQEAGGSSDAPVGVRVSPLGIMEREPYWSNGESTDSNYSERYSDDSD